MPYLRWNDHSTHVMSLVSKLYKDLELTDCTLDTNGGLICGHRLMLGACSPYLKKLILDQGMEIIQMKEVKLNDMKHILDFLYFGEVDVSVTDLPSLIETARLLQIPSLSEFSLAFSENSCLTRLCDESMNDSVAKCTVNGTKYDGDLSVEDSDAHTGNVLKELSQTHMQIAFNNSVPNSIVTKLDIANEETEHLQDDWTPFTFVAVSPCSVKSERNDDELNASCGPPLEVENPLEAKPVIADLSKEIKREREVQCGSELKTELEEVVNVNESNDVSHGVDDSVLKDSENICGMKCAQNVMVLETVGCDSDKGCVGEGMQMEFEAVSDIPKCEYELSEVKPNDTGSDNDAMDDNNYLLCSDEVPEPFNCEEHAIPIVNFNEEVNQALDFKYTKRMKKELSVALERSESCPEMTVSTNNLVCEASSIPSGTVSQRMNNQMEIDSSVAFDQDDSECVSPSSPIDIHSPDFCATTFSQSSKLKVHKCIHTGEKPYKCDVCGTSLTRKESLITHMRIHTGEKPYSCDVCGFGFSHKGGLNVHMRIHSGEKPYKCNLCGVGFSRKDYLNVHMRIHTGDKPYKCDVCGFGFSKKADLNVHMRIHTGEKPYKCDVCGYGFSKKGSLNVHMRIHTGEKPYMCDDCGLGFSQKGSLNVHMRIHTGEKPHKCDLCGFGFSRKDHLNLHMCIHTREKPYICDVCGFGFSKKGALNVHMRLHAGEKPHKCDLCGFGFSRKHYLNVHMRIHTNVINREVHTQ